jgi:hypothetical protein
MWDGDDLAVAGQLDGSRNRRVLVQRQASAPFAAVVEMAPQVVAERALVADDHVVEALSADGSDAPFDERILLGRPSGSESILDQPRPPHRSLTSASHSLK